MRRFDLVIFDNDGVLVDSEPFANRVLAELLTEYGFPIDAEGSAAAFQGSALARVREIVEPRLRRPLPEGFEEEYHRRLFQLLERGLQPVEGVEAALDRIPIRQCVASSGTRERLRRTLELVGLWGRFRGVAFSAEEVANGKPAPDLFLFAARRLGAEPGRCAVIEDTPAGLQAAAAAGMTSFGYARRTAREHLASANGGIFFSMDELPELLA